MLPTLKKEKLMWMAGEIHLARRRIREAIWQINNSADPEFFRKCYRFEIDNFKQFAPFYAYEDKEFLKSIVQGNHDEIQLAIDFLEADPYCFRSGYIKKKLCTALKKAPLTREERSRLRNIILQLVSTQRPVSFADIASLGCCLYTPGFHTKVKQLNLIPYKYLLQRQKRFLYLLDVEVQKRKNIPLSNLPTAAIPEKQLLPRTNSFLSLKTLPLWVKRFLFASKEIFDKKFRK